MRLRNVEVNIAIGDDLKEYKVKKDARSITCYIASEAEKKFTISLENRLKHDAIVALYYMDGKYLNKHIACPGSWEENKGVSESDGQTNCFLFSNVQVADDDNPAQNIPNLGSIEIRVFRVILLGQGSRQRPRCYSPVQGDLDNGPIHEQNKIAGLHQIMLTDPEPTPPENGKYYKYNHIDTENHPYATFRFIYRPVEFLKAKNIIRTPKTSAAQPDRVTRANTTSGQVSPTRGAAARNPDAHATSGEQRASGPSSVPSNPPSAGQGSSSTAPRTRDTTGAPDADATSGEQLGGPGSALSSPQASDEGTAAAPRTDKRQAPEQSGSNEPGRARKRPRLASQPEGDVKPSRLDESLRVVVQPVNQDVKAGNANIIAAAEVHAVLSRQLHRNTPY
ncbi:hypothetical protein DAEQUDRAFT_725623 [Daedalea quercina L-15889]|uniref:DUF7918 domain-containing protein n=1 Tax=Daedalea quercina L-15889 TaxID=1314783 RepID=A0A165R5N1_9APHY|nr:hypothetical protein DAEQUDRAFT_725623 [Daedalea quercina L-15889]